MITTLTTGENPALRNIYCSNNNLLTLDVSMNSNLGYLECYANLLETLIVSNATLGGIHCSDNFLVSLDISSCTELEVLFCANMPSLSEVCVWTLPFPPDGFYELDTTGSPNVFFTTDCSR